MTKGSGCAHTARAPRTACGGATVTTFNAMIYLHILLFGFWLGADVAVLYLSRVILRPDLTPPLREFLARLMLRLDTSPVICMTLMLPVGLTLAARLGLSPVHGAALVLVWMAALLWMGVMLTLIHSGADRGRLRRVERSVRVILILVLTTSGLWSLATGSPFSATWLSAKVLLFAAILGASLGIDVSIGAFGPAMGDLIASGSTPAIEARLSGSLHRAYVFVYLMYALILAEAAVAVL
jgi:hypothetical protein